MKRRDFLTPAERSERMSLVRSTGTKCEKAMARLLRAAGIRYRTQRPLPGHPDFVLADHPITVFVDGAFWHGRRFDAWQHKLAPFWHRKIQSNMARDHRVNRRLRRMGFSVLHVWEDDLKRSPSVVLARLERMISARSVRQSEQRSRSRP